MSREARVGIFVLLGLVILTYFTFRVSKWGLIAEQGYKVNVDFESAAGLEPKSDVKMAGVPIGKVEEIKLVGNRARLVLRIRPGVRIPADSVASIQSHGFLGERYVEVVPGKDAGQAIQDGGQLTRTVSPMDVDALVKKLDLIGDDIKRFTSSISESFGTDEGKQSLQRIIANIDRFSANLSEISSANKEDLRVAIANLRDFSAALKEQTPTLVAKLERMSDGVANVVGDNRENLKESIANIRNASSKLDNTIDAAGKVMARIDRGEGTLGKLIADNTAHDSLTDTLSGINRYVRKSEQLKTFIDYRLEWLARPSEYKHYANIRFQPTADKYYQIGIVDDPRGKFTSRTSTLTVTPPGTATTTLEESYDDKLKVTALIAKRFNRFTVKGGVLESSGGVGLDYDVFKDRFTLGAEIFDFSRKDLPPHLKVYGNYDIVRNFFITGGVDDALTSQRDLRTLFLGFGIKFADEDIKTIIGAVPLKP
jgi:phospholipid/cholesterol/gamma-HCH transport system substrate-binding protein